MKIKHFVLLSFLLFSTSLFSQSEEETLNFLNTMLASYSAPMGWNPVVWRFSSMKEHPGHLRVDMKVSNETSVTYFVDVEGMDQVAPMEY